MFALVPRVMAAGILLLPSLAAAEPVSLKLSFISSDRSKIYEACIKPFVDAVNAEGIGLVHVETYLSGAISGVEKQQPQIVSDDVADLAFIVPGSTADRFHDTSVLQLPGLFHGSREANFVFTSLVRAGLLSGYEDFHVVGAFVTGSVNIHSRKVITSIADLKGLTIRINNPTHADLLQRFGAIPVILAMNKTTEAMISGRIDGAAFSPFLLTEFGLGRVTTHHFMMGLGGAPGALVMNRKKFESLPPAAQAIIRKYGGERLADVAGQQLDAFDLDVLERLETDPRRTVVYPSIADMKVIQAAYDDLIAEYAGSSDHNRKLLAYVRGELGKLRPTE